MIRRRAGGAGIETRNGNHTFRATSITAYLKNGGQLETAAAIANHSSDRTTQLYERRSSQVSLDEIAWVRIWIADDWPRDSSPIRTCIPETNDASR